MESYAVKYEYTDIQGIDVRMEGELIALCSKQEVILTDMTEPFTIKQTLKCPLTSSHWTKVLFNPHEDTTAIAATLPKKLFIYDYDGNGKIINSYCKHNRPITDISWNFKNRNTIASCGQDGTIVVYDKRMNEDQVCLDFGWFETPWRRIQWNKCNDYILASVKYNSVDIWDIRNSKDPCCHWELNNAGAIRSIDWNPMIENDLLIAGHDVNAQIWDMCCISNVKQEIESRGPIFKASFLDDKTISFAEDIKNGYISIFQLENGGELLYQFQHPSHVIDYHFIKKHPKLNNGNVLISWTADQYLTIWNIDTLPGDGDACIFELDQPQTKWPPNDNSPVYSSAIALDEELANLARNFPWVTIEKFDPLRRKCIFKLRIFNNEDFVNVSAVLPFLYPFKTPPIFEIGTHTLISNNFHNQIKNSTTELAFALNRYNRPCLIACLKHINYLIEKRVDLDEDGSLLSKVDKVSDAYNVPSPRTCSAIFAPNGRLASFLKAFQKPQDKILSRSHISRRNSQSDVESDLIDGFLINDSQAFRTSSRDLNLNSSYESHLLGGHKALWESVPHKLNSMVRIHDMGVYAIIDRELAIHYSLSGDSPTFVCYANAKVAKNMGRADLYHAWSIAGLIMDKLSIGKTDPLDLPIPFPSFNVVSYYSFGKRIVFSLLRYFEQMKDFQSLALFSCVFSNAFRLEFEPYNVVQRPHRLLSHAGKKSYSEIAAKNLPLSIFSGLLSRSNSIGTLAGPVEQEFLLDPSKMYLYKHYKKVYADILSRWGLLQKRAEILRYVEDSFPSHDGIEFASNCNRCHRPALSPKCHNCNIMVINCLICRMSVKGPSIFCLNCGHGGHANHIREWFKGKHDFCPAGCGCRCIEHTQSM